VKIGNKNLDVALVGETEITGVISGAGDVTIRGAENVEGGTDLKLELESVQTYTGLTTVDATKGKDITLRAIAPILHS
jgi:hypothetical protein